MSVFNVVRPIVNPIVRSIVNPRGGGFAGLLNLYPGAAAAYSLRALSSGWLAGDVVEVRRGSDSTTQSFTASQITSGAMLDFVTTPIWTSAENSSVDPYDTFTGASISGFGATLAAGLGQGGFGGLTGDSGQTVSVSFDIVVNSGSPAIALRASRDSAVTVSNAQIYSTSGSYTIDLVATGDFGFVGFSDASTPVDFVVSNFEVTAISADGFVSTWYDQSGNGNDAIQITTTQQPKIVSAGALVTGGLDFDGVNDSLVGITNLFSGTSAASSFIVGNADSTAINEPMFAQGSNAIVGNAFVVTSEIAFRPGGNTIYNNDFIDASTLLLSTIAPASSTSADVLMFLDGSAMGQVSTTSATLNYGNEGASIGGRSEGPPFYDGKLGEIIIYPSDQSANRAAIEANINDFYSIY